MGPALHLGERIVAFARAAALGQDEVEGATKPETLKDVVLSAPPHWELTTNPQLAASPEGSQ